MADPIDEYAVQQLRRTTNSLARSSQQLRRLPSTEPSRIVELVSHVHSETVDDQSRTYAVRREAVDGPSRQGSHGLGRLNQVIEQASVGLAMAMAIGNKTCGHRRL